MENGCRGTVTYRAKSVKRSCLFLRLSVMSIVREFVALCSSIFPLGSLAALVHCRIFSFRIVCFFCVWVFVECGDCFER